MLPTTASKFKCPLLCSILLNLLLGFTFLNAQIIYTDIEPDYASANLGDLYNLDLNNDGTVDFTLSNIYWENYWEYFAELNANPNGVNGAISVHPWATHMQALNYGMEIFLNPHITYGDGQSYAPISYMVSGYCFGSETGCNYDWAYTSDKYIGLRFLINGQIHYGWARLDVFYGLEWTLKDYAYQATPNTMILAGEMPTLGLDNENVLTNIKITSSDNKISVYNLNETHHYTLFSITGQSVLSGSVSKDNSMINTSTLSSGLYVIELSNNRTKQTIKKKVII